MKKLIIASAVAALSVTTAQAAPTLYGKVFVGVDYNNNLQGASERGRTTLNSHYSRIGFKGSEPLSAQTDAVYKLEYGIGVNQSTSPQFTARETYVGLNNKELGSIKLGRVDGIDGNVDYVTRTEGPFNGIGSVTRDGDRSNNAIVYESPDFGGSKVYAMYAQSVAAEGENPATPELYGAAVTYEPEDMPMRAGASYIKVGSVNTARVSAGFDVGPVSTGALYQIHDTGVRQAKKETDFAVSAELNTATPFTPYAQVDFVKMSNDNTENRVIVGSSYAFSDSAKAHLYGGYTNTKAAGVAKAEGSLGIGGGLQYSF